MGRIKISITGAPVFSTDMDLMVGHINYGGHMGNEVPLELAHEARVRYFKTLEQDELNFFGNGVIMTDSAINYKTEGLLGDKLTIEIYIGESNERRLELLYKIINRESKKVLAHVQTGLTFFDYDKKMLAKASEDFLKRYC